jgi:hypothetical protein
MRLWVLVKQMFPTHGRVHSAPEYRMSWRGLLGHRQMETTYKYVHLDRTNLRAEMEQGAL